MSERVIGARGAASAGVWVVIPARLGSTRLPNKPLVDIGGLPLLEHVRRRACLARGVGRVLVATDSEQVGRVVQSFGGDVRWTEGARTGSHRVAQAAGEAIVPVINVQGDQPLLDPAHVERVAAALQRGAPIVTLSAPWPEGASLASPDLVKVVPGPQFTRRSIAGARLHIGIYGFQPDVLARVGRLQPTARSVAESLEQLAWLEAGLEVEVLEVDHAEPAVDSPAQLDGVRRRFDTGELALPPAPAIAGASIVPPPGALR